MEWWQNICIHIPGKSREGGEGIATKNLDRHDWVPARMVGVLVSWLVSGEDAMVTQRGPSGAI